MDFMYLSNDYKQVLVWICYAIPGNTKLHVWYVDKERNTAFVDDVGLAGLINDF